MARRTGRSPDVPERDAGEGWATHGLPTEGSTIEALAADDDGSVWVATLRHGLSHFHGQQWTTYTPEDGLPSHGVVSVAVAPDGTVWTAESRGGVARFDGEQWSTHSIDDPLTDIGAPVAVGPEGALWASTDSGVAQFDGDDWTTYTNSSNPRGDPLSLAVAEDGTVWVGRTSGGVRRLDSAE